MLIFPSWGHRPFLSVFWYQTHVGKWFFGSSCAYMIHSCCSGNMFSEQICVSGNKVYIFGCVPVCLLNCLCQFHASIPAFMSDVWSQGLPPHCLWAAGGWWGKNLRSRWITSLQWGTSCCISLVAPMIGFSWKWMETCIREDLTNCILGKWTVLISRYNLCILIQVSVTLLSKLWTNYVIKDVTCLKIGSPSNRLSKPKLYCKSREN